MPPQNRAQQRLMYAAARRGEAWAQKWIREGKTKVTPKGGLRKHARRRSRGSS